MDYSQRKFETGDVVRLASDIHETILMTVRCYAPDTEDYNLFESLEEDDVFCVWLDVEGHAQDAFFREAELVLYKGEKTHKNQQ